MSQGYDVPRRATFHQSIALVQFFTSPSGKKKVASSARTALARLTANPVLT